jgi:hypothetical protein
MAASPVLRNFGFSSVVAPVLGSIFETNCEIVAATCAVWVCKTGVYPGAIAVGWWITIRRASSSLATVGGLSAAPIMSPRLICFLSTPLRLKPTLSPASADSSCVWWVSIDLISPAAPDGITMTFSPGFILPVSTLPTGTVPTPVIEYTSCIGILRGLPTGFSGGSKVSSDSARVGPLYQGIFSDFLTKLSPFQPDIGTKFILAVLYPTNLSIFSTASLASL